MSETCELIPPITHVPVTAPSELEARLRADVEALRDDIERLHELPEPDRGQLATAVGDSFRLAQAAWRQALPRIAGDAPMEGAIGPAGELRVLVFGIGEYRVTASVDSITGEATLLQIRAHGDTGRHPDPPSMEELIHQLSPALDIETPVEVLQARRNAEARALLLSEFGALTSSQVADLLGSEAKNRSALPHRWRKEQRLLAVAYRGAVWFPGFQFHEGEVLPVIREVLGVLAGAGLSEWETALWFTAPNGWLDDRRPVNLLLDQPGRVVDAARSEVAGFGG